MRVALVHYWLVGMRGGEKVLEALCELFPDADIFTLVADRSAISETIARHRIETSFLQRLGGRRHYQKLLPLMPLALESFDLSAYDLVVSSESGPAKGVIPRPDALHVCYCHSPMRYIWDLAPEYRRNAGRLAGAALGLAGPRLRQWDVTTAARVDHFIANSAFVARRIEKYYRRDATVIHPPVDRARFAIGNPGEAYLCAGQVTPCKRIELAVEAFTRLGRPLVVIGDGVTDRLRGLAGPNVRFLGPVGDAEMAAWLGRCRALVFPGVEDFGIVPLEAMASGRPVIAFGRGGALETVIPGRTGVLFAEQTVEALVHAVSRFELIESRLDPRAIRAHAEGFSRPRFLAELRGFFAEKLAPAAVGMAHHDGRLRAS